MKMFARTVAAGVALAAAAAAGVAVAQDFRQNPTYGVVNLTSGFTPDPQVINLQSGGQINAQTLGSACRGFIANAPDVRLNYRAGSYPLIISVSASADTTLVVNGPNSEWYCDDDGGVNGNNPSLRFNNPTSGQYDIWVGTYANASYQAAALHISEVGSQ